jgi:cytochrome c-type biogenesis protein CcmF
MIAEFGLAALWLAAALAGLQLLGAIAGLRPEGEGLAALVRPAAVVQALLCTLAFGALLLLFARTDLSVALVAKNSHSLKPFIFKLAGAWGNHEGSMLLWVSVMALAGGLIAAVERRLPEPTMLATLGAQAFVGIGFYAFLLLSSNPFERLAEPAAEGMGLNPLLQDIGLAFHPPTLYLGYVGLSVAFSFAVGALLTREVTPDFAKVMRPWILGAWIFLTLGITAGSYWAYYELGWGGWWFWDPVENASLMPWLAATALLHSASVLASRDALRTWTILLGVVAFSMSMVGTFLVRTGIHQRACLRGRPGARRVHPCAAGALHRRSAGAVRGAGGDNRGRRALRLAQPRGRAGGQQRGAVVDPRDRPARHALSAADRGVRCPGLGRPTVFQPGRRDLFPADAGRAGGRPAAALAARQL